MTPVATFCPEPSRPYVGHYLGVPVIVTDSDDSGWLTALWPDNEHPGKRPYSYRNGEQWKLWHSQVRPTIELPSAAACPPQQRGE